MTTVAIRNQTDEVFCQYPRQSNPQPARIVLHQDGDMYAEYDPEIGNAVSSDMWHGRTRSYSIPLLRASTINQLLAEIEPLAQRVLDGLSIEWNGHNHVGVLTEDAEAAEADILQIIEDYEPDLIYADAGDWLHDIRLDIREALANGQTVEELMDEYDGDGSEDRPILTGLRNYLEQLQS